VRILGETGDPKHVKLLKQIFEKENSYVVQAESLTAIGKCGGKKQVSFLKKAAEVKSYRNIVQKSANEALTRLQ
jgi:aminopeptidase N